MLRIFVLTWRFERIAARLDLAADVPCFAGDAGQLLPEGVVGLQLGIGDAPILDGHLRGDGLLAVPGFEPRTQDRIQLSPPPRLPIPLITGPAPSSASA